MLQSLTFIYNNVLNSVEISADIIETTAQGLLWKSVHLSRKKTEIQVDMGYSEPLEWSLGNNFLNLLFW